MANYMQTLTKTKRNWLPTTDRNTTNCYVKPNHIILISHVTKTASSFLKPHSRLFSC